MAHGTVTYGTVAYGTEKYKTVEYAARVSETNAYRTVAMEE